MSGALMLLMLLIRDVYTADIKYWLDHFHRCNRTCRNLVCETKQRLEPHHHGRLWTKFGRL